MSAPTSATRRCASGRWASAAPPTPSRPSSSSRRCARRSPRRCAPARSASPPAARRCTARRHGIRCPARSPAGASSTALGRRAGRGGPRRLRAGPVRRRRRGRGGVADRVRVDDAAGARHRRPISLALIQNLAYPDAWREALTLAEDAATQRGAAVVPQMAVRARRRADRLRHRHQPAVALSGRRRSARPVDRDAAVARLRDPARARPAARERRDHSGDILGGMATLEHVFPLTGDGVRGYETTPDRNLVALARAKGVAPLAADARPHRRARGPQLLPRPALQPRPRGRRRDARRIR